MSCILKFLLDCCCMSNEDCFDDDVQCYKQEHIQTKNKDIFIKQSDGCTDTEIEEQIIHIEQSHDSNKNNNKNNNTNNNTNSNLNINIIDNFY